MIKKLVQKSGLTKKDIEQLLQNQTATILMAVDNRLEKTDARFEKLEDRFEKSELRFNRKLDQLMTTLDRFLKRLTDSEDEFIILKKDVNHIKAILKEKLGVNLS